MKEMELKIMEVVTDFYNKNKISKKIMEEFEIELRCFILEHKK